MSDVWIIDDRPWEFLTEEEKQKRKKEFEDLWNSFTDEERKMIDDGVREMFAKEKAQAQNKN